jgi:hypothetical protein
MAEDIRLLGADTHIPRRNLPIFLVGGAALLFVLFRGRQAAPTSSPTVDQQLAGNLAQNDQTSLEFYQIQQQAQQQLAQLMSANMLQQQQMNQAYMLSAGLNPGLLQQCIPFQQWYNLQSDVRGNLTDQVRNGQLFQTIGANGICFGPTSAGIAGHQPYATARSSTGLFSSSSSITGPNVGQPPTTGQPAIGGIFDLLNILLGDLGIVTPNAVPRYPNPYPTAPSYPYQYPGYPGYPTYTPPIIV